ncbi:MAG TPA: uroporphyrinogen-III C-methyltransferase [Egibacteraceae bacterium]|nr:uroporphyrinogen-III C-methyltransferase [Egibacteraceae bacterium]
MSRPVASWPQSQQLGAIPFGGPPAQRGTVHLVGGGPGDPGLLSVRAARLLSTATFVAYDRLSPPEALALCAGDCERAYVGKLPDRHALTQEAINELLVSRAAEGHAVVRLKGGDPFVLGRGSEEAQACVRAGTPFEVVPGVTSAVAAPAYAGIPVTHRGLAPAFAVVTGHEDPGKDERQVDWVALASFPGTLVLLMGVRRIAEIAQALIAAGKAPATPVALVRWGSTPRQQTLTGTLGDIGERVAQRRFASPAVTVIGQVAELGEELSWFESRPLHGASVLVPRTRQQASELSERLRALGAEAVEAPTIAIEPSEPAPLRAELASLADGAYDWIALTSANAVHAVWEQIGALGADARLLAGVRIAAVGSGTADALSARGLRADLLPEQFTTRGLAEALIAAARDDELGGRRALLPRADIATPALGDALRDAGWHVSDVEAYRTVPARSLPAEVRRRLANGEIDAVALASSSTARNLVDLAGGVPDSRVKVASIGPVTSQTCRDLGLRVDAEAEPHNLDGLVQAVRTALGR